MPNVAYQTAVTAKSLATMYYFLPGVPFIYQGQELGMKNFERRHISKFNDVSSLNDYEMTLRDGFSEAEALQWLNAKSRDNARTPLQWTGETFGGFSEVEPWFPMGEHRADINVATEEQDPASVLNYYRRQPQWHDVIIDGTFHPLTRLPADVIAYQRRLGDRLITVLVNLSVQSSRFSSIQAGEVLTQSVEVMMSGHRVTMAPYTTVVMGIS